MLRRLALIAALFGFLGAMPMPPSTVVASASQPVIVVQSSPPLFDSEAAAQAHCPKDVVVWLNVPTGIFHYKGERWYGRTKHGAYACEKEAIAAGDRASLNGQ